MVITPLCVLKSVLKVGKYSSFFCQNSSVLSRVKNIKNIQLHTITLNAIACKNIYDIHLAECQNAFI